MSQKPTLYCCSNIYAPCSSPITTEIWGSFLNYFFINYTLRPDTLARRSPFRSSRQPAELLSEVNSLHRIKKMGIYGYFWLVSGHLKLGY